MPLFQDKQVEFPELQTHVKMFETVMIVISVICVIAILVIVLATDLGNTIRP